MSVLSQRPRRPSALKQKTITVKTFYYSLNGLDGQVH